jgi:hypothetical protein
MMGKLREAMKTPIATPPMPIATTSVAIPPIATKPLEIKPEDIAKKEASVKKGSPLKGFLERKKKPKEYYVQKCESMDCSDCGKTIFSSGIYSGCICYGENQNSKLFLNKNEKGELSIRFSKGWSVENIEMLLETLRGKNGRH